jgi:hypothetical protein
MKTTSDYSPSSCWTQSFWTIVPHLTSRRTDVIDIKFVSKERVVKVLTFLSQFLLIREQIDS